MKIFAVVGEPILHSLSPYIFNTLFHTLKIPACYTRLAFSCAEETLKIAREMELSGMNVTSPLKEDILNHLDCLDDHAEKIRAVNTVAFRDIKAIGYNTDYIGVIQALRSNSVCPKGRSVVILGAGGAARAAAYGMKISQAKKITIANRNLERAQALAQQFGGEYTSLHKVDDILDDNDILISCIPQPISSIIDTSRLNQFVIMDANYNHYRSPSGPKSKNKHNPSISGLDWLFFQAVQAFRIFSEAEIPEDLKEKLYLKLKSKESHSKPHVALIGIMGSGKTSIGKKLADELKYDFVDTDSLIEKHTGQTIPKIFKQKGEKVFRGFESSVLERIFKSPKASVVSLGGGAILDEKNLNLIRKNCLVIWLWISAQGALRRIDFQTRPLLVSSDPKKTIESLLAARKPLYARASDLIIDSEGGNAGDMARRIKHEHEMDQTFRS